MDQIANQAQYNFLHFIVQNVQMCIDLQYLDKILPLAYLNCVPGAPPYLAGLLNVEGTGIPIIDIAILIGIPRQQPYTLSSPLVMCIEGAHRIGLIVDKILDMSVIENSQLQFNEDIDTTDSPFSAVVNIDSALALVINTDYLFKLHLLSVVQPSIDNKLINMAMKRNE
jgi:purine-binding chemotaxis protein CheW